MKIHLAVGTWDAFCGTDWKSVNTVSITKDIKCVTCKLCLRRYKKLKL